jgi:hypothetical protein
MRCPPQVFLSKILYLTSTVQATFNAGQRYCQVVKRRATCHRTASAASWISSRRTFPHQRSHFIENGTLSRQRYFHRQWCGG